MPLQQSLILKVFWTAGKGSNDNEVAMRMRKPMTELIFRLAKTARRGCRSRQNRRAWKKFFGVRFERLGPVTGMRGPCQNQVFHFDADWNHDAKDMLNAMRVHFPAGISPRSLVAVRPTFHALISAKGKLYRYRSVFGLGDAARGSLRPLAEEPESLIVRK